MKILELTNFSAGVCGVWTRVREEALRLSKRGHEVKVFSSNLVKGSSELADTNEVIDGVVVRRFSARKLGGESYMFWLDNKARMEIRKYRPDIIIAHSYRHPHTDSSVKISKSIGAKSFLVTHAPFGDSFKRSFVSGLYVRFFYDLFVGKNTLNMFDKIISITKWEVPYLKSLGVPESKISYIPNGVSEEFFNKKAGKKGSKIVFLGRISPVKDVETLINSLALIRDEKISLDLVGPVDEGYKTSLVNLIKNLRLSDRVNFVGPVFDISEKINKIDSARVFVLPSKREGMPQSLVEAMARKRIVIASDNEGSKELVRDGENGYLFRTGDSKDLAKKIDFVLSSSLDNIASKARDSVRVFSWENIINKLEGLFGTS